MAGEKKSIKWHHWVIPAVVIVGVGGYFIYQKYWSDTTPPASTTPPATASMGTSGSSSFTGLPPAGGCTMTKQRYCGGWNNASGHGAKGSGRHHGGKHA